MSAPRVLLGVSGGIAAYKAADIVRALVRDGAEVQVILTARAAEFVAPLTLATLSGRPVARTEFPDDPSGTIGHIDLARWGEALVVAPASANTLARLARGLAADLLSTVYLAFQGPVVVAPAMNPKMWDHPATRESMRLLARRGVAVVDPDEGYVACGDEGAGKLANVTKIVAEALWAARTAGSLAGVRVAVSAGPTFEPIDAVRYVGNRSSGKMGYAVAAAARARGADVILVSGPTALSRPFGVTTWEVDTADEMREAMLRAAEGAQVVVMAAAVADHRPAQAADGKLAHKGEAFALALEPTADVLAELVARREPGQKIVGFAAEAGDAVEKGRAKLARKKCDLLVVNDVTQDGAGFGVETNRVTLLDPAGGTEELPLLSKREVAERILDRVGHIVPARP